MTPLQKFIVILWLAFRGWLLYVQSHLTKDLAKLKRIDDKLGILEAQLDRLTKD